MKHGPIFDRALDPAWLDIALSLAKEGDGSTGRELDMRLRDRVEAVEGRKKTVRLLSRVWLKPSPPIKPMISWAIDRSPEVPDARPLHVGGLLAAYPFFGDACRIVGRAIALSGRIRTQELRRGLRDLWGDREIVDVASRCGIRTLRGFGVLTGVRGEDESAAGEEVPVQPFLTPWIAHALLLTRGADEAERQTITAAPELFMLKLGPGWREPYPLLEPFREGGDRLIMRAKSTSVVSEGVNAGRNLSS